MGEFVLKNIEMTLDPASIQNAIDEINDLSIDLQYALDAFCEWLLKHGVNIARMRLHSYGVKGSNLARSIRVEMADGKTGKGFLVAGYPGDHGYEGEGYADISYAVFVEFGFGNSLYLQSKKTKKIVSASGVLSDHIAAGRVGYRRAVNGRKKSVTPSGQTFNGWVYKNRNDDHFYVSQGQPPRPFMYDTFLYLLDTAEKDAGRIIAEYIV